MRRNRIVVATSNYWQSPLQVGSHHLARGFVEAGWEVAFISDPISPWHLLGGNRDDLRVRYETYAGGGRVDCDGHLWTYVPGAWLTPNKKPILRTDWVGRHWPRLSRPPLIEMLRRRGFGEVELLYCDSIFHTAWLDEIQARRSLYRVTDNIAGFAKTTAAVLNLEKELARKVDVVVYAARVLEGYVKTFAPRRMAYLPNGVNYAHFARPDCPMPGEYRTIPRPIALYVGAMDVWFNYRLLDEVAARLPSVSFVLIGPDELARRQLRSRPNIHLLGRRPYADLPPYMHHADVGLIPFDVENHAQLVQSIHPLKLYEYFACGLPVVATYWDELASLNSPARLCRGVSDFVTAIAHALAEPPDKPALQRYAAGHDWRQRVAAICTELGFDIPTTAVHALR